MRRKRDSRKVGRVAHPAEKRAKNMIGYFAQSDADVFPVGIMSFEQA